MTDAPRNELDPNQVVLQLLARGRELQKLSNQLDGLETEAVEAKEVYTVEYARHFLNATGSNEVRKQKTLLETSEERLNADIAEAKVKAQRNQIATLKVRVDIGRSAAALVRAEADLLNMRGRGG
jgi:hypothetical protein